MSFPWTIVECGDVFICRDDLIPGGTKRRALDLMLPHIPERNLMYAGTIFGHGALALALAAQDHGKQAHLFLSSNDSNHPIIQKLKQTDAIIHRVEPLPVEELLRIAKDLQRTDAHLFPLAFDTPAFQAAMVAALRTLDVSAYPELWCVSVSGTFARALKTAFPDKPVHTISVVKSDKADYNAPEKYHQCAKTPPPFPACPYTDAKLWQFVQQHAAKGALIWNIAG